MDQQIVNYLQKNKGQYTQESLIQQLRNAGHNDAKIQEAIRYIYEGVAVRYAGFWIRFVAIFIDGLILIIPVGILAFILGMAIMSSSPDMATSIAQFIGSIIGFIVALLYFAFMTNEYQATLGKMAVGIKVCDANTLQKSESGRIWMRELINRLFLTIPFLVFVEIVAAFTQRKQGLHDMAAKTVVVYKNSNKKMSGGVIAVIVAIGVFLLIAIIGIFSSVVLVSLNSARNTAQDASVKSSILSTVPVAIICMDDGSNINPPVGGMPICKGVDSVWPVLAETGEWGELIKDGADGRNFEYTATYANGTKQVTCTETGCNFSDNTY